MNRLAGDSLMDSWAGKINVNSDRAAYNYIKHNQSLRDGDPNKINPNATITEGYLRSEVDLLQQNNVKFPILVGDGTANVTERRLQISQMFLVTQISLMLYAIQSGSQAARASSPLRSYAALDVNGGATEIGIIYNGSLRIEVDQTVYFDALDCTRFRRSGTAQEGVEVSAAATNPAYVADTWDCDNYGFYRLVPFIYLGGQADNKISLNLPLNVDLSSNNACAVMQVRGMLIQNAYKNSK